MSQAVRCSEDAPGGGRPPGRHLDVGREGEDRAAEHLASLGYVILARRFRTRAGEIDLVARDGATVVFVEVKTRSSLAYGRPAEAVGFRTRSRVAAAAALYLASRAGRSVPACRFDVVEVIRGRDGAPLELRHIRSAFEVA